MDDQDDIEAVEPDLDEVYQGYDFNRKKPEWMSLLPSNHNQVEECMQTLTREFSQTFAERHLLSHLQFYTGSLNEAITKSSFDPDFTRPLVLYIRHAQSVSDNQFCTKYLCNNRVVDVLNNQFLLWPWDRTNMERYRFFIQLLIDYFGNEITSRIVSSPSSTDQYPLLVFLAKNDNQCRILDIINGQVHDTDTLCTTLTAIRNDFDEPVPQPLQTPIHT